MEKAKLKAALQQARSTTMHFAFLVRGGEGDLMVARAKIPGKDIAEAKKELGGGTLFQGTCFGEGGAIVFATARTPPGSLAAQILRAAKEAGVSIKVETRAEE